MPEIVVITPTYNEKENIKLLVKKVFELGIPNLKMVVVDDNSADGTGKIADELSKTYPLEVIHREKKMGLGTAYIEAFKKIFPEKPNYIIQMDADLSHDPIVIPKLLKKINPHTKDFGVGVKECDVVLGSRYVPGGRIENWDAFRKFVSWGGNLYARIILQLPYRDLTGGFKCWRREVLENIGLDSLSSIGYNFQIETTYRAHRKGYKICEIPITFTERKTGVSKFNLAIIFEGFFRVCLLRLRE